MDTLSGISCDSGNIFWAINVGGAIDRFSLTGNIVTNFGVYLYNCPGNSLAYCNNLNGNGYSPTFYSDSAHYPAYFNGTGWVSIYDSIAPGIANAGGNGNYLYYQAYSNDLVRRFDGITSTIIYHANYPIEICIADLSVDDSGNVYFIIGPSPDTLSDSLVIISPTGQVLKELPYILNCNDAYGSFLMNGIYYIGLGPYNSVHPNTLIPITITPDSAIQGTPISMPPSMSNYLDLTSCNPGMPLFLSVTNINSNPFNVKIFPNPFSTTATLLIKNEELGITNGEVQIINLLGQEVKTIPIINQKEIIINRENLPTGMYFYKIIGKNNETVAVGKMVVE
jgi:hypothetical protein